MNYFDQLTTKDSTYFCMELSKFIAHFIDKEIMTGTLTEEELSFNDYFYYLGAKNVKYALTCFLDADIFHK